MISCLHRRSLAYDIDVQEGTRGNNAARLDEVTGLISGSTTHTAKQRSHGHRHNSIPRLNPLHPNTPTHAHKHMHTYAGRQARTLSANIHSHTHTHTHIHRGTHASMHAHSRTHEYTPTRHTRTHTLTHTRPQARVYQVFSRSVTRSHFAYVVDERHSEHLIGARRKDAGTGASRRHN